MISNLSKPAIEDFSSFAKKWFRLLSQSNFAEALELIDEPNSYGIKWSKDQILLCLRDYLPDAEISDPSSADGLPDASMGEFADGSGFWFEHSVPLNGGWSDLTAQFEFMRRPGGFVVILNDLHVL